MISSNETWIQPTIHSSELLPYKSDLATFCKTRNIYDYAMLCDQINNADKIPGSEVISRSIDCDSKKSLIVISAYHIPNRSIECAMFLRSIIRYICFRYDNSTIWIWGDSNTIKGNQYRKYINDTFLSLEIDLGLIQFVQFQIRGPNVLDIFLKNRPSLINICPWN